ncbi:6612_t:CDS:2 [Dentiscutata heterogama]|uniref:6612_t:CDS:1 n=1 Tax=Dentiscutata heterogama TaxID=1316150 RepID=A0ACA9L3K4_9GLOM|nr:6612_t:CDS:2 [Dentiscutata heterogama]
MVSNAHACIYLPENYWGLGLEFGIWGKYHYVWDRGFGTILLCLRFGGISRAYGLSSANSEPVVMGQN